MKTYVSTEFECPECGSSCFGSRGEINTPLTRTCGSEEGCTFEWPEADDWKYFGEVTRKVAESPEEYEKLEKED